jgi:hypothetical protein
VGICGGVGSSPPLREYRSAGRETPSNSPIVQILVVVATILVETKKTEVGKGSVRSALRHG